METGKKLLIGGLILVGSVVGYKTLRKKQDDGTETPDATPPDDAQPPTTTTSTSTYTPPPAVSQQSYTDKVKVLQRAIGVADDGKAGPITMARLNKYLSVPVLNASTIDLVYKLVPMIAAAVASLSTARAYQPKAKLDKWNYWVGQAKAKGITFDPYVTRAYASITGRSAYADYKDALAQNSANDSPAYSIPPFFGGLL